MAAVLQFPKPGDAQVAAKVRGLCRDFGLSARQEQAAMSRYLETLMREKRGNGVASYEACKVMHAPPKPSGDAA